MTHRNPFSDISIPAGEPWELAVVLSFDRPAWPGSSHADVGGIYVVAAGSDGHTWRLKVTPDLGRDEAGMIIEGAPIVDLAGQTSEPTPLEWLTGLMSGGMAKRRGVDDVDRGTRRVWHATP